MATNAEFLERVPLFAKLGSTRLGAFADACVRAKLEPGEFLFHEGDPGGALYVIVGGRLRIERLSESGEGQVLGVRGAGEFIGEMSLLDGSPRSATAVAETACRLLVLQKGDFERLILEEPSASLAIMQGMARRIREAAERLVDLRGKEVWERLLDYLAAEANEDGVCDLPGTQAMLAEHLGCTREAANRAMRRLEAEGRVERLGRRGFRVTTVKS